MAFNPREHVIQLKGRNYLETKWRIAWFRDAHPNGCISTELVDKDPLMMRATVFDADGNVLATGFGSANDKGNAVWSGRALEKAESAAIGRALGHAGFGTQFLDGDDDHLADSPVERRNASQNSRPSQSQPPRSSNAPANAQGQRSNITPLTNATLGNTHQRIEGDEKPPKVDTADDMTQKEIAKRFIERWRSQSLTDTEVLAALGVTRLSEWTKGRKAADEQVNAWLASKLAPEHRDWDFIWSEVSDYYKTDGDAKKARDHFAYGTVKKLTDAGVITETMSDAQVIAKITAYKQGTPIEELKQFEAVAFA